MNLLVITQKVDRNDSVLGFFHRWLEKFAEKVDKLIVVALEVGEYNLPKNVEVLSLGKEEVVEADKRGSQRGITRIRFVIKFYSLIWKLRKDYDAVFVHMNPEYVVLAGWFWKLLRKKIFLWYVHREAPWQLQVAEKFVNKIYTVSLNSCRIKSGKVEVVGHGIDSDLFKLDKKVPCGKLKLLSVGRYSPIKDYKTLIEAIRILVQEKNFNNFHLTIVGGIVYESDEKYRNEIWNLITKYALGEYVTRGNAINYYSMPYFYNNADLLINLCPTGGKDKVVLEAMASGVIPIVANESFKDDFGPYADTLIFKFRDARDLANKIMAIKDNITDDLKRYLREQIEKKHNLENLINKILKDFSNENIN